MGVLYDATVQRTARLRQLGYTVVEMWGCEWSHQLKTNDGLREEVESFNLLDPLSPRDALFGGRTNALKLHHEADEGETIRYYDIKSLYPFVNARRPYPIGHPEVRVRDFGPLNTIHESVQGLIKCTVKPPRHLYIPVLPIRTPSKKLVFPLCRTCAIEQNDAPCHHDDEARNLTGTWTHVELSKAVEKGYEVVSVYETWHWQEWTTELFAQYIDTFYAVKEQASGWPSWVETEEDKQRHCQQVLEKDGVRLDPRRIEKNPGLRQVSDNIFTTILCMKNLHWKNNFYIFIRFVFTGGKAGSQ